MKIKNHRVYSKDIEWLKSVLEDYRFLGRQAELKGNAVIVYALPKQKVKKKEVKNESN